LNRWYRDNDEAPNQASAGLKTVRVIYGRLPQCGLIFSFMQA
jgi:hypothetical protein